MNKMKKKSLIFCLVVVAAFSVGLTLYHQKWKDREYVDLQTIKWTQMGSFSEFNNKEVVEIAFENDAFCESPIDVFPKRINSRGYVQLIVNEIKEASRVENSKVIGCVMGKIWFVFKDGTGSGFRSGEGTAIDKNHVNLILLKDSSGDVRASNELFKGLRRIFGPESEEEEISPYHPPDFWGVIDLRKSMPKGNFLEASIVELNDDGNVVYVRFEIPKGKMSEFQTRFGPCIIEARKDAEEARKKAEEASEKPLLKLPYDPIGGITKLYRLGIVTDMGKYAFYLTWTDDYVRFDGLTSKDFRKVLSDVGFKGAE